MQMANTGNTVGILKKSNNQNITLPADANEPITTVFPDGFLGVLAISSSKLGVEHLRATGVPSA